MTPEYWHWLALGILLMGLEIFLPTFVTLWFGVGALIVGVLMMVFPGMTLAWQMLVWSIGSAAFTWAWFGYFKRRSPDRTLAGLSREAILGETGHVISAPFGDKRGVLRFATPKLGSEEWQFICQQPVVVGDRVAVDDVSGNTLIVSKR